ncbi:MAG: phage portal protein, partial [Dehalococcoidia bacterium]|nr:phage portal protein [Dehalococcoidia bacterium]
MTDPSLRSRTSFTPSQLARMDTQRLVAYRTNLDFYNGSQWQQTSRHRQLVFNYAKVSIDKVTSFLMPGLGFACYPGEETDELKARVRKAEQLLRQVYEQNNLQQLDYETEIDTAILGDGCYKVIWDTDEKRIHITAPDVSGIYAWWLGDDTSRVWRVASRYTLTQDEIAILYGRSIEKKQATITELWTTKTLDLYLDNDLIESKPNPYGFIPFVIFPNVKQPKKFWGESDIPVLVQPQRELNRA